MELFCQYVYWQEIRVRRCLQLRKHCQICFCCVTHSPWTDGLHSNTVSAVTKINVNQQFGNRLRHLRQARGWSQEEFGARCNLDRTYISGIERGVRNPTLTVIATLAVGLEISIEMLFVTEEL